MATRVLKPHCSGLNFLLPRILYGERHGPMMLVRGQAGTGKTILVADFAMGTLLSRPGFHVAVFDVEQGEEQARRLATDLGHLGDLEGIRLVDADGRGPNPELAARGLWYHDLWASDWHHLQTAVETQTRLWEDAGIGRGQGAIILDSLNALSPDPVDRAEIRRLRVEVTRRRGWWLIIVCESDLGQDKAYTYLDYETDILLWLTAERPGPKTHSRRMLEIVKCRGAPHVRGKHHFAISSPAATGQEPDEAHPHLQLRVFPSLASKLSDFARQLRCREAREDQAGPGERPEAPREGTGIRGLSTMLGGVPVGSATAYVGPPGSRKGPCAFHFALAGEDNDDGQRLKEFPTLIVSLGADEPAVAALASDYRPLKEHLLDPEDVHRFLKAERKDNSTEDEPSVAFRMLPPGYASAAACVSEIEQWLDELKPRRVIISDISQIKQQFPVVDTDVDPFLSTLVQLFRAKRVTSLFVETTPEPPEPQTRASIWSSIGGLVDNVVEFRHLFFYGSMHLGVSVTRRHGAAAEKGFWEMRTHEGATPQEGRALEAVDNLHGFTDFLTREPRHAPLNIHVYADTALQRAFNRRLGDMIARAFPGIPGGQRVVRTFGAADACYTFCALEHATDTPQPDIRIATIDEFWVKRLHPMLSECPSRLYQEMEGRWIVQDPTHVPRHLNVGLIAALGVSDDVLQQLGSTCEDRAGTSWADLHALAEQELARTPRDRVCAFDFGKEASESWSCLLLEILSSAGTFATCPESGHVQRFELSPREAVDEFSAFCELFWLGRDQQPEDELKRLRAQYLATIWVPPAADPDEHRNGDSHDPNSAAPNEHLPSPGPETPPVAPPGTEAHPDTSLSPLFRRLWYVELTQWLDGCPDLMPGVAILRPPGTGDRGQAMRGEWYWCVISGGSSDRTGWEIIDWLTSEAMATRQYVAGVGLPAHSFFYKTGELLEGQGTGETGLFPAPDGKHDLTWVRDNLWRPGLRRAGIAHYPWIAPLLANLLFQILCLGPREKGERLRDSVARLLRRAEGQIDAISPGVLRSAEPR